MSMLGLSGRRVVLTGGASGIGRATALRLAEEGCIVGIFDLNDAGARQTAEQCADPARVRAFHVDITDAAQVSGAVAAFEGEFGPTDGLANIAGWDQPIRFLDTDRAFWDKVIQINLYGP